MKRFVTRFCVVTCSIVAAFYILILSVLAVFEKNFVYFPYKIATEKFEQFEKIHPGAESVTIPSGEFTLHANLLLNGDYVNENTIPILFCHGNGGWIGLNTEWVFFEPAVPNTNAADPYRVPARYAMLLFDYRGYGFSAGFKSDLSEAAVYADARAARKWLADRCGCAESEVVLMGHSLGGGVATELATDGCRKLVLFSTFDSVPRTAESLSCIIPCRLVMRNKFDSASKIGEIGAPLLQFHGTYDCTVPYRNGARLFEHAKEPKTFVTLPRFGHQYGLGAVHVAELEEFLNSK